VAKTAAVFISPTKKFAAEIKMKSERETAAVFPFSPSSPAPPRHRWTVGVCGRKGIRRTHEIGVGVASREWMEAASGDGEVGGPPRPQLIDLLHLVDGTSRHPTA
jgi:hypothetical protein